MASFEDIASNLFLADTNFIFVDFDMYFATQSLYPLGVLIPVPTAVPPNAISDRWFTVSYTHLTLPTNREV